MAEWKINGTTIPVLCFDTIVVGSGCAGFNGADWLCSLGQKNVALVTEGRNLGTSRNTGSDKQTYYKLSLSGGGADSVEEMAETLYSGSGVDGETALAEAAGSVRSFMKLANLGVPFPTNRFGEYVGYKTDHDPRQRATSAGPLTSRFMTEKLEASLTKWEACGAAEVLDGWLAVRILKEKGRACGLLCVERKEQEKQDYGLRVLLADAVLWCSGGPAGLYEDSVYPLGHQGMTGIPMLAGAQGANLQEWQYGLASVKFRWNVSGTYQQALPRYVSVDKEGQEHEFLPEYFDSPEEALSAVFLKGYQWPFDIRKLPGSSVVDMLVYHQKYDLGRRVYLDFRKNPSGLEQGFEGLSQEARVYLEKSGAVGGTPYSRLEKMNPQAIELYRAHGIDLAEEMLEISVCAQHQNGGLRVDSDWQTTVPGLYAAGEAAGTFGIYRPGGSALNSTQVGSMRAAEHIVRRRRRKAGVAEEKSISAVCGLEEPVCPPAAVQVEEALNWLMNLGCSLAEKKSQEERQESSKKSPAELRRMLRREMSRYAAELRSLDEIRALKEQTCNMLNHLQDYADCSGSSPEHCFRLLDQLAAQTAVLSAMELSGERWSSRGSALVLESGGRVPCTGLESLAYAPERPDASNQRVLTRLEEQGAVSWTEEVRPVPERDQWFETVWADYRERME